MGYNVILEKRAFRITGNRMSQQDRDYIFSNSWFQSNQENKWLKLVDLFKDKKTLYIEIGSYEGQSLFWVLENVLLHPESRAIAIDTFQGSMEHDDGTMSQFMHNADVWKTKDLKNKFSFIPQRKDNDFSYVNEKLVVLQGSSLDIQTQADASILSKPEQQADLIFIDGSHRAQDVLSDAVFAFKLCKIDGIIIFDDYKWDYYVEEYNLPRSGINAFLAVYANELEVIYEGWQLWVKKVKPKSTAATAYVKKDKKIWLKSVVLRVLTGKVFVKKK